jgi:hypothetical protein
MPQTRLVKIDPKTRIYEVYEGRKAIASFALSESVPVPTLQEIEWARTADHTSWSSPTSTPPESA